MWDLSSPTRDWTPCPWQWKLRALTTGPPVKPPMCSWIHSCVCVCVCDGLGPLEHGSQGKPASSPGLQAVLRLYLSLWTPTLSQTSFCINEDTGGLPWWSMVKTSSSAGVWVWSLVRELGSHMPFGQKTQKHETEAILQQVQQRPWKWSTSKKILKRIDEETCSFHIPREW